jgi:PKD repeat protein
MITHSVRARTTHIAVALLVAGTFASCNKAALLAPTGSRIVLTAGSFVLPINGSTQVIATVTEQGGTPVHDGTTVVFFPTLGSIEPREAQTTNGQAVATFFAGAQSGTAVINASSGGATTGTTTSSGGGTGTGGDGGTGTGNGTTTVTNGGPLQIAIGGAAATAVSLTASPTVVPAAGGTVDVTAAVTDANGNLLFGVPVNFRSTTGSFTASTVTTDGAGQARTRLTTNQNASVTAHVLDKNSNAVNITVTGGPVVGITSSTTNPVVGQPVTFSITLSQPQPTPPASSTLTSVTITNAFIDFGDGPSPQILGTAPTQTISHVYRTPGTYTVTAVATDDFGQRSSATMSVTIAPAAPISVTIGVSATPTEDAVVTFTATVLPASSQALVQRYEWDFGDGATTTTSGNIATHIYQSDGPTTVTVRAVTVDGASATGSVVVNIAPGAPINVTLTASPATVTEDETVVTFTANATGTGAAFERYQWNFGDGNTASSSGNTVSHVYGEAGQFTARVTVFSTDGRNASGSTVVSVQPRGVVAVTVTATPSNPAVDEVVQIDATATPPSGDQVRRYKWTFGDGTGATTTGDSTTHVYKSSGRKVITVEVETVKGSTGTGRTEVQVQ